MRTNKFKPCKKCRVCGKPISRPKANKSGLCCGCLRDKFNKRKIKLCVLPV